MDSEIGRKFKSDSGWADDGVDGEWAEEPEGKVLGINFERKLLRLHPNLFTWCV